jgi:peptidyl-prolyl cis-trans isomerase SurA
VTASSRSRLGIVFLAVGCVMLSAEIVDRVAVSIGTQVITDRQIEEEVRVTEFQNSEKLDLSAGKRKQAAERLIEQALIKREMDLSHYPLPDQQEAETALAYLRAQYPSQADFGERLHAYGIAEEQLKQHLWWQVTVLRFIDFRFRPGVQVPEQDLKDEYRKQVEKQQREGGPPIPLYEQARPTIEEKLTEERVDQAVDRWLGDARTQVAIRFHEEELQ